MTPEWGDIVLIPVPFTDLSSQKRRPVIVISNDDHSRHTQDVVVVAMTSNPVAGRFGFEITSADLADGVLNRPGMVRPDKIYTLDQSLIVKRFGRVNRRTLARIRRVL
jgi:mRNA interferase MazF